MEKSLNLEDSTQTEKKKQEKKTNRDSGPC